MVECDDGEGGGEGGGGCDGGGASASEQPAPLSSDSLMTRRDFSLRSLAGSPASLEGNSEPPAVGGSSAAYASLPSLHSLCRSPPSPLSLCSSNPSSRQGHGPLQPAYTSGWTQLAQYVAHAAHVPNAKNVLTSVCWLRSLQNHAPQPLQVPIESGCSPSLGPRAATPVPLHSGWSHW